MPLPVAPASVLPAAVASFFADIESTAAAHAAAIAAGTAYQPGGTDVAVADGGTGASTAAVARTNLGLVIGTDVAAQSSLDQLDWKQSCRACATTNVVIASGLVNAATVDGVTLSTGNRVLLTGQTAGAENGIYVVVASGAASRATDADASAEVTSGMAVVVTEGTANGDAIWLLTTNDPITLGTTALTFTSLSAALAAHLADTSAAHAASAVSADSTTLVGVGTDVQAVLEELDNGIADHLADATAAHAASAISYAGGTGIAATDVEAAIDELATEKADLASPTFTGEPIAPSWQASGKTGATATPIRLAGGTTTGAPTTGAHLKGEIVWDDAGVGYYCTVAGTPGTWVSGGGGASVSDTAYAGSWDAVTTIAPSKNAVYDKVETLAPLASPTFTGLPTGPQWKSTGVTGANTTPLTISGANATGAPSTGAHVKGEIAGDDTGKIWYCTVAGTPGTWVNVGGGGGAIRVEDEGVSTVAAATGINFAGAGVTVTDAGSNEALVTIPGGGSSTFRGARVYRSAALSLANNGETAVAFDAETFDSDALHDNSTNPERVVLNAIGKWLCTWQLTYAGNATGVRDATLKLNGTAVSTRSILPTSTFSTYVNGSDIVVAAATTDYVEVTPFQNSGGSLAFSVGTSNCFLAVTYLGA